MTEDALLELAYESLRLAQIDPQQSIATATATMAAARESSRLDAASVAERAWGLAALHVQDPKAATHHLHAAMMLGLRGGFIQLAAEARMSFAFSLNRAGQPERALAEIEVALSDLDAVGHARGLAQRAAILQQLGRLDEAMADYRTALPALRRFQDWIWVQRVLMNRGVLHTFRHAYGSAARDLKEAEQLCAELGLKLPAAQVHENLVFVYRRVGDVPRALNHLAAAERLYNSVGAPFGSLLVERSELLFSVGLFAEAQEAAEKAVSELVRNGSRLSIPEARLLLVRTAALNRDLGRAVAEARRAAREFSRQGRDEWVALAQSALVLARLEAVDVPRMSFHQLTEAAAKAEAAGWPGTALDIRIHAGRAGLAGRHRSQARHELELVSARRHRGPAGRRAKAWFATALLRHDAGNDRGSSAAAAHGLDILDEYRGTMAATDLRAQVSSLGVELARLGLRNALNGGSASEVLAWAERGRARQLLERPVLPSADPELMHLMAQLRAVVAEQIERRASGQPVLQQLRRQEMLEKEIRDASRRSPGTGGTHVTTVPDSEDLIESLHDIALVEFVELDEFIHAVYVVDGRLRLRPLGPMAMVRKLVRWLPFALIRLSNRRSSRESSTAAVALLSRIGAELDDLLLRPLAAEVGSRPLVLVPTGVLQSLPWSLLPSVAGRPVTVAPSAALWLSATRRAPRFGSVVVVAGPELPGAEQEAIEIAHLYGTEPILGADATVETVTRSLPDASILHLAAHGTVRADNPLFSSLRLVDGPLTVYDLERLDGSVDTVALAACESGRDVVLAGDELLGLSAAFLSRGARHVVASVVPIPDAATAPLMVAFHRLALGGTPVAEALAEAQRGIDTNDTAAFAAAIGFVCIGAGFDGAVPASSGAQSPVSSSRSAT